MIIIEKLSNQQIENKGIKTWPIWEKEISKFDWQYDMDEYCYILEGEVIIETKNGNFRIEKGDFVTFPKDLQCVWDIKKAIRKHYSFKNENLIDKN